MIVQINELWDFFLLILEVMTLVCTLLLSNFHFKMRVDSVDIFQIIALIIANLYKSRLSGYGFKVADKINMFTS